MTHKFSLTIGIVLLFSLLFTGCGASKAQKELKHRVEVEAKRPTWAKQPPMNNDGYYWGVGEVQTIKGVPLSTTQRDRAKQEALSDIANAISVRVSTQSLLATAKVSDQLKQTFQKTVRLSSKLKLEGVELVDSYRDEYGYMELYRLDQALYHQQHKRTLQSLLDQSSQWLNALTTSRRKGDYRSALLFGLKTLNALSDYWDEELQIIREGKMVNPIAEADREINEILRQIIIRPIISPLEMSPSEPVEASKIGFRTSGGLNDGLANLPLRVRSEGVKLTVATVSTDDHGVVLLPIRITANDPQQSIVTATLDLRPIITAAAVSESIGQYALRLQLPEGNMQINRLAPLVRVTSSVKGGVSAEIQELLRSEIERKGITISDSDKAITVEITPRVQTTRSSGYYTVSIEATIRCKGINPIEISTSQSAVSETEALRQCYSALATEIRAKVVGKIYNALFI